MRKVHAITLLSLMAVLVAIAACERVIGMEDVPSQSYNTLLDALGEDWGSLRGQIFFPSEYTQRSVAFRVDDQQFVTHPDGRFHILRIPSGSHRFAVSVKGFEPVDNEIAVATDEDNRLSDVRLALARGQVIGRLVFLDGNSATGLQLRLEPNGSRTASDGDGIFQFIGVNAGEHTLEIEDPRFYTKTLKFRLAHSESRNLGKINVFLRPGAESSVSYNTAPIR